VPTGIIENSLFKFNEKFLKIYNIIKIYNSMLCYLLSNIIRALNIKVISNNGSKAKKKISHKRDHNLNKSKTIH